MQIRTSDARHSPMIRPTFDDLLDTAVLLSPGNTVVFKG